MHKIDQRIVVVTRKTRQDEMTAKFGTTGQAQFYVTRSRAASAGGRAKAAAPAAAPAVMMKMLEQVESAAASQALGELKGIEDESRAYREQVQSLRTELDLGLPVQVVDRSLVPNMVFGPRDVVVVIGQDGLVANVAKYALGLPIIGVNPAPSQYDGVLLPFVLRQVRDVVRRTLEEKAKIREVTLAEGRMNDGQRLLAFNDLFIGAKSHVSARYRIESGKRTEQQSSSGMIVSTGAGSTGWFSSVINMVAGVASGKTAMKVPTRLTWEERKLLYVVREPFVSKTSSAGLVAGSLNENDELVVESLMGPEGTIFSDGVEADSMAFAEGAIVTVGVAKERARLVVP